MTLVKKFGLGAVAAALFMAMAMATLTSTAYADVDALTADDDLVEAGTDVTLEADLDATAADGDEITFRILGSSDGEGSLGEDEDQTLVCTVVDDGAGAAGTAADPGDCDDGTAEVDLTATGEFFVVTLQTEASGDLDVSATHGGVGELEVVTVVGEAADVDSLEVDAPASIEDDGVTFTVDVTALDEDGEPVEDVIINADPDDADVTDAAVETDDDGEAEFEFTSDDDATSVVITFYTGSGLVTDADTVVETVVIPVAGDAAEVVIDAPESVEAGGTATISATVLDEDESGITNEDIDFIVSAGSVAGCDDETDDDGMAECTFVAPNDEDIVQLTVVSGGEVAAQNIEIGDAVDDDDDDEPVGEGEFEGEIAASGSSIVVFTGGSVQDLIDAAEALDENVVSIYVTSGGDFVGIILGAPDFVNAEFTSEFSAGLDEQGVIVTTR